MSYRKLLYGALAIVFAVSLMPYQAKAALSTPPRGWLDSCVSGWAFDTNTPEKSIDVHVYVDKPAGVDNNSGFAGVVTTGIVRDDVNTAYRRPRGEKHGFEWVPPKSLYDGLAHKVYVYGIDTTDISGASNALLDGAPQECKWSESADAAGVITVTSPAPANLVVGQPVSEEFRASGGTNRGFSWQLSSGSLPPGLQLGPPLVFYPCDPLPGQANLCPDNTERRSLTGTPTTAGAYTFVVKVTDGSGQSGTASFTATVSQRVDGGLIIDGSTNVSAAVEQSFSASFSVSGGTAPYRWQQISGTLPDGVNITFPAFNCITTPCVHPYDTALFKGTPTQVSSSSATYRVTDATGRIKEFTFTIVVAAANGRAKRTGYVDVATSQRIEGWAFDSAKPEACVVITYKRNATTSDNAQYTQDVCPTITRADAAEWILKNFGNGHVITQPLGFRAEPTQVLFPGTYSVVGVKLKDSGVALDLGEAAKLPFTIVDTALSSGSIVISSPAKNVVFQTGQVMNIAWTGSNTLPVTLKLVERRECELVGVCPAVLPRQYVIAENYTDSSYNWTIPSAVVPANYQVYIETSAVGVDSVLWGRSGVFSIQVPRTGTWQVTSPVAREQVYAGYTKNITWNVLPDTQNAPVSISYAYTNHPLCLDLPTPCVSPETVVTVPITTTAPNTGSYAWSVPASLNGKYTIVMSVGGYTAESGQFSVVSRTNPETIVVKAPAKDEVWSRGETRVIYWSPNVANTKVSVSVTRYVACLHNDTYVCALVQPIPIVIESSAPDIGSYEWTIPKDFSLSGPVTITITNATTGKTGESAPFQIDDGTVLMPCSIIKPGQVVVGMRGTVYVITPECKKYGFTSLHDFTSRGYNFNQVVKVDQAVLDAIPTTEFFARPANTSFMYSGQRAVYYLGVVGCKEVYPSPVTLRAWGVAISSIVTIPTGEQYPDCNPSFVRLPNNTWAQVGGQPTVYHVEGTVMRPYATLGALVSSGFQSSKLYIIRPAEFSLYTVGDPIQ